MVNSWSQRHLLEIPAVWSPAEHPTFSRLTEKSQNIIWLLSAETAYDLTQPSWSWHLRLGETEELGEFWGIFTAQTNSPPLPETSTGAPRGCRTTKENKHSPLIYHMAPTCKDFGLKSEQLRVDLSVSCKQNMTALPGEREAGEIKVR